ncbi:hypothetical protein RhiirA4_528878 [Rhizophagus irregularis]|uniref:HMG box domain-containing protein n=2 Tax=Rhizophagus irregularis TaxID=588596 RepID=A0A2I1FTH0_9GLOM|nr:hypothetical protein RhiirA4_528878 [Rhizophagus irregularis]
MSKNRAVKRKAYELQGNYRVFSLYENASIDMNPCKSPANKTIHFVGDTCDNCDGMVNNLTLDAELLSENSDKTRKAISNKKKGIVKVPRPPNAFIIYRREKKAKHNDVFCKRTEADISKEVGKMWQNEPEDIKDMYYRLAEHAKKKHLEKYSGYRYQPEREYNNNDDDIIGKIYPYQFESFISWFGIFLIFLGIWLRWYAMKINKFFTRILRIGEEFIVTEGPYRYIRHPGYLGQLLIWIGFGLSSGNYLVALIIFIAIILTYLYRIRKEEVVLLRTFGVDYLEYSTRVSKLIPYIY